VPVYSPTTQACKQNYRFPVKIFLPGCFASLSRAQRLSGFLGSLQSGVLHQSPIPKRGLFLETLTPIRRKSANREENLGVQPSGLSVHFNTRHSIAAMRLAYIRKSFL
jgi:hypothetical protein